MLNLINKMMDKLNNRNVVGGAALVSTKKVLFTDTYADGQGFVFAYYDESHTTGGVEGPYSNLQDAVYMRNEFVKKNVGCSFLHQGLAV
jgi:hypothetical protein